MGEVNACNHAASHIFGYKLGWRALSQEKVCRFCVARPATARPDHRCHLPSMQAGQVGAAATLCSRVLLQIESINA